MEISNTGLDFIKRWEALRLKAYKDTGGVWTIGWGHIKGVFSGMKITELEAHNYLKGDLKIAEHAVNFHLIEKGIVLQQHQYDAIVSLVFNLGSHQIFTKHYTNGFAVGSTLYNRLLMFDFVGASERFTDFVKDEGKIIDGLVNRRKAEKAMFLKKKVV